MADQFTSFEELLKACGKDSFRIEISDPESDYAIIAPHGGHIEPRTDVIAHHIASGDLKYYAFKGKLHREEANQHITSTNFNEPKGDALVRSVKVVVAIHGRKRKAGFTDETFVGGGNKPVRQAIATALNKAGFKTAVPPANLAGEEARNICNRCAEGGVQLELTRALRQQLTSDAPALQRFAQAIRTGLGLTG